MDDEFIKESDEEGFLIIDNVVKIEGFISEDSPVKCHKCQEPAIYCDPYDAYMCAYCNMWLEKRCGDKNCEYCSSRPAKPLPNENRFYPPCLTFNF
jgi:hypothetical protein